METNATDHWSRRSVSVIVACGIGNIVGVTTIINATFSNFLVPVSQSLGWERSQFSLVLTLVSLVGVFAYPFAGRLIDRYGTRPIALGGNILFGLSVAMLAFMPAVPIMVYPMFVLLGFTASLPSTVLLARVISTWFVARRGLALGLSGGVAFGVGGATIPPVTQWMIDHWGWQGAYLGLGGIVIALGFPVFFLVLKERPGFAPSKA